MAVRLFPTRQLWAPRRVSRALTVVMLVLQGFLWGAGSIAEAKSAAESLLRYTHIEDQGDPTCPPIHSHLDCVICRTMHGANAASPPALLVVFARDAERGLLVSVATAGSAWPGPLWSRGPPAA